MIGLTEIIHHGLFVMIHNVRPMNIFKCSWKLYSFPNVEFCRVVDVADGMKGVCFSLIYCKKQTPHMLYILHI